MPALKNIPGIGEIRQLPADLSMTVPPQWEDRNGHVNVQYYQTLYELGGWRILEDAGVDARYLADRGISLFDIEHHLHYLAEIHVGETVSVHNRMLGRGGKLFHGMIFIVNDSRQRLACTIEYLSLLIDLRSRRSMRCPRDLAARLDAVLSGHQALEWQAPVCGLMEP